jgi:hypothetical protein
MALRDKLEGIKHDKVAQEEVAKQEVLLSEQEKTKQEEASFLDAYARKHTLAEATVSLQEARNMTNQALEKRKEQFRNITGLMDQIQAEDPTEKLPSFKEVVASPEEGSDEEGYVQSREEVTLAISELRKQKEVLKKLGVEADGLSDDELLQAVYETRENAYMEIQEFLAQHPDSELPEAIGERAERVTVLEQQIGSLQRNIEDHTQFGREHVTAHISSFHEDPESLPNKLRKDMGLQQQWLESEQTKLAQISLYEEFLEGRGIMANPEVARTYEPIVKANNEVRDLENELAAIKRKPTSKLFGYTEKKKQEELSAKEKELADKKVDRDKKDAAYNEATAKYQARLRQYESVRYDVRTGKGAYQSTKAALEKSIITYKERVEEYQKQIRSAEAYFVTRQKLLSDLEVRSRELAVLKGEKVDGSE